MSAFEPDYEERGVVFVTVNAYEPRAQGRAFAEANDDLHYTWLRAEPADLEALGVKGIPSQIILDREGKVAWTSSLGSLRGGGDAIREALDELL